MLQFVITAKIIVELLKRNRMEKGLTIKEVADICQVPKSTIIRLEKGEIKNPSILLILSYLKAVGIPKGEFFSKIDEMEIKELLPKEIEKGDYPPKAKKKIIKYALGIEYQKRGVVSFPEYAKLRIEALLTRLAPEERGKYLSFAEDYFNHLKMGERLEPISERYKGLGLNPNFLRKIKKIIASAYRREMKRAERRVIPDEKKKEMLAKKARDEECRERFTEGIKRLIFKKEGMTTTHLQVYLQAAIWFYGQLKKRKAKLPPGIAFSNKEISFTDLGLKEIDEWREAMLKQEPFEREILNEVTRVVIKEYCQSYLTD